MIQIHRRSRDSERLRGQERDVSHQDCHLMLGNRSLGTLDNTLIAELVQ